MDINECFKKGLLKKIPADKLKTENSIRIAENKLSKSKELLKEDFFDEPLLSAYTLMFHSARALLYRDGIQEKSHFAVYIYINEKYFGKFPKSLIEAFKIYQSERHKVLYGFDKEVNKGEAESAVEDAEEFLIKIKELLK